VNSLTDALSQQFADHIILQISEHHHSPPQQCFDISASYFTSGSCKTAQKESHRRYPHVHLKKRAHSRVDTRFLAEGSVQDKNTSGQSSVFTAEKLEDMWLWLQKSPRKSQKTCITSPDIILYYPEGFKKTSSASLLN